MISNNIEMYEWTVVELSPKGAVSRTFSCDNLTEKIGLEVLVDTPRFVVVQYPSRFWQIWVHHD